MAYRRWCIMGTRSQQREYNNISSITSTAALPAATGWVEADIKVDIDCFHCSVYLLYYSENNTAKQKIITRGSEFKYKHWLQLT